MHEMILKDLEAAFGLCIGEIAPVSGGYLNKKWRVSTDRGELLVKQYSHERFNRRKLDEIEQALERQMILYEAGIPCPRIWKAGDAIIRRLSEEIDYMAMEFLPGEMVGPDAVTLTQMESLGEACGRMHKAFRRLPVEGVKGYPLNGRNIMEGLHETVRRGREECPADAPEEYRAAVDELLEPVKRLDEAFLGRFEQSIVHEDFTPDNMLFGVSGLTAILDFDRNQFSFPLHDVGRALLSLALTGGGMDWTRVNAFRKGYERHGRLTERDAADALRLAWMIEVPWWIQPSCFGSVSPKVARFVDEMRYLSKNMPDFEE